MAWVEQRPDDMRVLTKWMKEPQDIKIIEDPKGSSWKLDGMRRWPARSGMAAFAARRRGGYAAAPTLATAPQFDVLRGDRRSWRCNAPRKPAGSRRWRRFAAAGGERLLGK
jgi:hypothetical protein